jgi:GDPmannose 4,6-dehydratase
VSGDLRDLGSLVHALEYCQPDEVYNLGAISQVLTSFRQVDTTVHVSGLGALRLLEALRIVGGPNSASARFFQASSASVFGRNAPSPQNELTPFRPSSPHGIAKAYAHQITVNYRESYGLHASCGILFNHASERQGTEFVTRKVSLAVARIALGLQQELRIGETHPKRDWGYAGDYVVAMWRMLQQDEPDDYVIATGVAHSVEDVLEAAFDAGGLGEWQRYVSQDQALFRPTESALSVGDPSKAAAKLQWRSHMGFHELIQRMVRADIEALSRGDALRQPHV